MKSGTSRSFCNLSQRLTHVARPPACLFEYAQGAIRAVILANGAVATALLAYAGAPGTAGSVLALELRISTAMFAFGVACGVGTTFLAYLSQYDVVSAVQSNGQKVVLVGAKKEAFGRSFQV